MSELGESQHCPNTGPVIGYHLICELQAIIVPSDERGQIFSRGPTSLQTHNFCIPN